MIQFDALGHLTPYEIIEIDLKTFNCTSLTRWKIQSIATGCFKII